MTTPNRVLSNQGCCAQGTAHDGPVHVASTYTGGAAGVAGIGPVNIVDTSIVPPTDYLFHYKLDGNDANVVGVNSPTLVGAPGGTDNRGYAVDSVVAGKYLTANADSSKFAIGTGPLSICFRIMNPGGQSESETVIRTGTGGDASTIRWYITTGGAIGQRTNGANEVSASTVRTGLWQSVIITNSGSGGAFKAYIDGVLDKENTSQAYNLIDSGVISIGDGSDLQIDDIYLYNRVLDQNEVTAYHNNQKALWTPLNDSSLVSFCDTNYYAGITQSSNLVSNLAARNGVAPLFQTTGSRQIETWNVNYRRAGNNGFRTDGTATNFLEWNNTLIHSSTGSFAQYIGLYIDTIDNTRDAFFGVRDDTLGGAEVNADNASQFNGALDGFGGAFSDVNLTGGPFSGDQLNSTIFNWNDSTVKTYLEGVLRATATDYLVKMEYLTEVTRLQNSRLLGTAMESYLYHCAITTDLSDNKRYYYEGYDAWKRGTQSSLPTGHMFENNPPFA